MKGFPFTRKRLLSLPEKRKHKWIGAWLKENYLELISNQYNDLSLDHFWENYQRLIFWLGEGDKISDRPTTRSEWIEFMSNRFHEHQQRSGRGISEGDFLPKVLKNDRPFDGVWQPKINYTIALDNLRSAFNVGSIIRVMDATGLESLILSSKTPGKENSRVQKTAMGSEQWIPTTHHGSLPEKLNEEKRHGRRIIGVETVDDAIAYHEYVWPKNGVIVLGNEEYGLSEAVLRECDDFVYLPMDGYKNSINVANAFSVIAFYLQTIFTPDINALKKPTDS